ncbi:MAG: hypothetical protein K5839_00785 [Treponemataceae bacterium]|nr:hypothetical protein [Treponemataceae bacterium]
MGKNLFKTIFISLLALSVFAFTSCGHLEGDKTTVTINGRTEEAFVFDSLDQLKESLTYIEDYFYGQIRLGNYDEEFDQEKTKLTWDLESTVSKPDYNSVRRNVVSIKKIINTTVSSSDYGYYTYVRYTTTGGIRIFVYDETKGIYSEPLDFDFGCDVD